MLRPSKLLCLSNGHGEDEISVQILQELQQRTTGLEVVVLPIVGSGQAFAQRQLPLMGPIQVLPSGGFIYMDKRQLVRDLQGGLLQLTGKQLQAVRTWAKQGGVVLAVGDVVPLLFAWLSGAAYAFVGTAKSEYYLRDEADLLQRENWWQGLEGWSSSVYHPWERWLMSRHRCKAVFARDRLTTSVLQQWPIPAFDLGNPMMDLEMDLAAEDTSLDRARLTVVLLPGSRPPEAYRNWQQIVAALPGLMQTFKSILFLGAIAAGLSLEPLSEALLAQNWRICPTDASCRDATAQTFAQEEATLILTQHSFKHCLYRADLGIAMAGTATEQFVGLGKPAILIPGQGPQFTLRFAEAQTRLLGPSVILVPQPEQVAAVVETLLKDRDRLDLIAMNGRQRMGQPGAARRIAECLIERLI